MATSTLPLLLSLFLLAATSASARPCKTIFFFTSTSYYPIIPQNPNPNPNFPFQTLTQHHPRYLTFFFTSSSNFINPNPNPHQFSNNLFLDEQIEEYEENRSLSVGSSIRYRTKDIMSVVGALLFGVGCGALTAATMYLIWSLFNPNRFEFDDDEDSDDDFDSGDDSVSPKKMMMGGYVAIPTKVVHDDDLKKPVNGNGNGSVTVAKEVV